MKYYLSICCIIKNEMYLEEFIIYHHIQGVEHFYIYDNESDIPIQNRLDSFYYRRLCTIIPFPGKMKQMDAYTHCVQYFKYDTKWLAIIDGDEYIYPKKGTFRSFLNDYEDVQAIGINWVFFGSSFHDKIQTGYQIDKYRYCENRQNNHIKSVVQPKYVIEYRHPHFGIVENPKKYIDPKRNIISGPFNENHTIDKIQINHYTFRSTEDRIKKYQRGNADSDHRITVSKHHHYICNNKKDDSLADKYLKPIKEIVRMTGTNASIYKALNPDVKLASEKEYYDHIFERALHEKRPMHIQDKYPTFNRSIYRSNYFDIKNKSDVDIEVHYITIGCKEGRIIDRKI